MKSFITIIFIGLINAQTEANFSMFLAAPIGGQQISMNENSMHMAKEYHQK